MLQYDPMSENEGSPRFSRRRFLQAAAAVASLAVYLPSYLPRRAEAANMILADQPAWTDAQFGATDRRLGLLTLPDVLIDHDRVNRDKLGIITRAADIAEEDNARILANPRLNPPDTEDWRALGRCDSLTVAGILDPKPKSVRGVVLLIAKYNPHIQIYLTDANLGTEEGRQVEIDAQMDNFFQTRIPFMCVAPLERTFGLWYRPVNGVSADGQFLQVGNFGKPDTIARRDQIRFACQVQDNPNSDYYRRKQIIRQTIDNLTYGLLLPTGEELETIRQKYW